MKKLFSLQKLLENSRYTTKIKIFFSTKAAGEGYDSYEDNYTFTNLNPLTIKAYVTEISSEALVWKAYGLKEIGAKEIICKSQYTNWFKMANKVEIDGDEYEVFKEGVGNRANIQKRPFNFIRVILQKKS